MFTGKELLAVVSKIKPEEGRAIEPSGSAIISDDLRQAMLFNAASAMSRVPTVSHITRDLNEEEKAFLRSHTLDDLMERPAASLSPLQAFLISILKASLDFMVSELSDMVQADAELRDKAKAITSADRTLASSGFMERLEHSRDYQDLKAIIGDKANEAASEVASFIAESEVAGAVKAEAHHAAAGRMWAIERDAKMRGVVLNRIEKKAIFEKFLSAEFNKADKYGALAGKAASYAPHAISLVTEPSIKNAANLATEVLRDKLIEKSGQKLIALGAVTVGSFVARHLSSVLIILTPTPMATGIIPEEFKPVIEGQVNKALDELIKEGPSLKPTP